MHSASEDDPDVALLELSGKVWVLTAGGDEQRRC